MIERLRKCRRINGPIMNFFEDGAFLLFEVKVYKKYNFLVFEISCDNL